MGSLYPWFVFAHVGGTVLFVGAHGISMWVAFRVRWCGSSRVAVAGQCLSRCF